MNTTPASSTPTASVSPVPAPRNYPLLLVGQFLGAFGDNFLLAAILGPLTFDLLAGRMTEAQVSAQNAVFSAVFFIPFILLAPIAGFVNDRWPKTSGLFAGNLLKLLGTAIGFTGVWLNAGNGHAAHVWQVIGYTVVGLGACIYSPAKYGILPEILPANRLVKANGTVEMLTLIAILGGLWGGAALYDHTRSLMQCYGASVALYAVATVFNALMQRTPCAPETRLNNSVAAFGRSLRSLVTHARLGRVLLGCGLFWLAGAVLRGNLQAWGLDVLTAAGVTDISNGKLALLKVGLILGIVGGSMLAGQLHRIGDLSGCRRYGVLMAVGIAALGAIGGAWGVIVAGALLVFVGVSAGLLLIPLNASLQHEGDQGALGKTIAVQNFVDYLAMLVGAGFLQAVSALKAGPGGVFIALAVLLGVAALALRVRDSRATVAQT